MAVIFLFDRQGFKTKYQNLWSLSIAANIYICMILLEFV